MSKLRKWMMKEERDSTSSGSGDSASSSAIKLFGKTIAVSGDATKAVSEEGDGASTQLEVSETGGSNAGVSENLAMGESQVAVVEERVERVAVVEERVVSDVVEKKVERAVVEKKVEEVSNPVEKKVVQQPQQQQRGLTVEERKEQCLKKPDKLIPCPRCESVDTKFCYYNNYNINQPRHFCKSCQRYWTAGGTLRNVLVGAGRRKNKYGVAQQQQVKQDGENLSSSNNNNSVVRMDHHEPAQRSTSIPPSIMNAYGAVPPPMKHAGVPVASAAVAESQAGSTVTSSAPGGFPVFSAFKPMGAETSSDSITKLRQRTRPEPGSGGDCASSISSPAADTTSATYVLTPRLPQSEAQALWTRGGNTAAAPLGFFNGAWPYGYNIGWSGPPAQNPVAAAAAASMVAAAAPPMWTGMWTSQVPTFGWNMLQGGWSLPWRPVPVVGVQMQTPSRKRDSPSSVPEESKAKAPRVSSSSEEVEA